MYALTTCDTQGTCTKYCLHIPTFDNPYATNKVADIYLNLFFNTVNTHLNSALVTEDKTKLINVELKKYHEEFGDLLALERYLKDKKYKHTKYQPDKKQFNDNIDTLVKLIEDFKKVNEDTYIKDKIIKFLKPKTSLTIKPDNIFKISPAPQKAEGRKSRKGKKAGRKGSKRLGKKFGKTSQKPRRGKKASKHLRRA